MDKPSFRDDLFYFSRWLQQIQVIFHVAVSDPRLSQFPFQLRRFAMESALTSDAIMARAVNPPYFFTSEFNGWANYSSEVVCSDYVVPHFILSCPVATEMRRSLTWLIFRCSAWRVNDCHFVSRPLALGRSCESWFPSSCHPGQAELLLCITATHRSCSTKPCKSKVLAKLQIYHAHLSQPICLLHGVLSGGSQHVKKNLPWKVWLTLRVR